MDVERGTGLMKSGKTGGQTQLMGEIIHAAGQTRDDEDL